MATIIGDYPNITRVKTGLYSLDKAFGGGVPMTTFEVYGMTGVGKSTFTVSLAGMMATELGKDISICPIEQLDKELLGNILENYNGKVHIALGEKDEDSLDALLEDVRDDKYCIGILDSLGAVVVTAEVEGKLSDVVMGRRAMLAGRFSRMVMGISNQRMSSPLAFFIINHIATPLGTVPTNTGTATAGGETKKYLSRVRLKLRRAEVVDDGDGTWVLEGKIEKYNYGKANEKFYVVVLAGKGIHVGLTALYDGFTIGIVQRGKTVKLGGKSYGYLKDIIKKARDGDDDFFVPFIDALSHPQDFKINKKDQEDNEE